MQQLCTVSKNTTLIPGLIPGLTTAAVFIETLSAPLNSILRASSKFFIPPPTVNGMFITLATFLTIFFHSFLCSSAAVMSKNINSSAPSSLYCLANSTGSPASFNSLN